jgi:hypothetical protein
MEYTKKQLLDFCTIEQQEVMNAWNGWDISNDNDSNKSNIECYFKKPKDRLDKKLHIGWAVCNPVWDWENCDYRVKPIQTILTKENEATIKQTFNSKLLSFNNGEFSKNNHSYELQCAIQCFYEIIMICDGITDKPYYEHLKEITNSPELIGRAHKTIAALKTEVLQVRSIIHDETIQK